MARTGIPVEQQMVRLEAVPCALLMAGLFLASPVPAQAFAPAAPLPTTPVAREGAVVLRAEWMDDMVPTFRVASRDRFRGELEAWTWLTGTVRLDARLDLRVDRFPSSAQRAGAGDLRLGTLVRVVPGSEVLAVGWLVKLPNAEDEGELGTDETDMTFWAEGLWHQGALSLGGRAGLAILGNPLLVASQDDVPLTWLVGRIAGEHRGVVAEVGGAWRTPRNPSRMDLRISGELGCPWTLGLMGGLGLTPAAPTWSAALTVGRARACRDRAGD